MEAAQCVTGERRPVQVPVGANCQSKCPSAFSSFDDLFQRILMSVKTEHVLVSEHSRWKRLNPASDSLPCEFVSTLTLTLRWLNVHSVSVPSL